MNTLNEIQVSYQPLKGIAEPQFSKSPKAAHEILREFYPPETIALQEQFVVLYLNNRGELIGGCKLFVGGITGAIADVRLILSVALKCLATGIIISHNHPSGALVPSKADERATKNILKAAKIMDITLLDHIILSPCGGYFSFADQGIL